VTEFKLIAILALVAGLLIGIKHVVSEHDAAISKGIYADVAAAQKVADDAVRLQQNQAALKYEEWKRVQQPKTVIVTKVIHDAIASAPVWASEPIPPGVRDAIAASITGPAFAPGEPASAVPVQPAASDNERGTSGGLRLGTPGVRGLFGAASSPS
jgi:hypothetical protein